MFQTVSDSAIETRVQCIPEGFDPEQLDPGDSFTVIDIQRFSWNDVGVYCIAG